MYIDRHSADWLGVAEQFLDLFREASGRTRGELEQDVAELIGEGPTQLVHQGLVKLLEDRCEYEVASDVPPEAVREAVFRTAAQYHLRSAAAGQPFDRDAVLTAVGQELSLSAAQVDLALFADLKGEQRILTFQDLSPQSLLDRYNVALVQGILSRSTGVEVRVWGESPPRYRQLFRVIKFHQLICEIRPADGQSYWLTLSGPLSLFSATQKYGKQLASFLPTLLHCKAFELQADVRWGADRKTKTFRLSATDGLRSHAPDWGMYTPRELETLVENFRATVEGWQLSRDPHPIPVEGSVWVPDVTVTHEQSGREVFVEVLGYWRKLDFESHYKRLRRALPGRFVLVVSEQYRADDDGTVSWGPEVYYYRRTPIASEVAKVAANVLGV
jgi:predicted nuclease of restriction endonuclease-like RecB superfamily